MATRNEAIGLFNLIRHTSAGAMSVEGVGALIILRSELRALLKQFDVVMEEAREQTRPKGWEEGDSVSEWESAIQSVTKKWLEEDCKIKFDVLSFDDTKQFIKDNVDLKGDVIDYIYQYLTIK